MGNTIIIDRNGNPIDDDDIVPDGGSIRAPMPFMDSAVTAAMRSAFGDNARAGNGNVLHDGQGGPAGFRPGYAFGGMTLVALQRRADHARSVYLDRVSNAWRNPPSLAPEPLPPKPAAQRDGKDPGTRDGQSAYRAYVNRIAGAWKTAT